MHAVAVFQKNTNDLLLTTVGFLYTWKHNVINTVRLHRDKRASEKLTVYALLLR